MKNIIGAILIIIGAVCFSAKAVMVKLSYLHEVDPITVLALRMLFSIPFYVVILFLNRKKLEESKASLTRRDWINIVLMGVVGYYLASIFDFIGLSYVTAGLERLILFIYPTLVVIISAVFLKKKIGKTEYIALLLTYLGVLIVFFDDAVVSQKNVWLGTAFIFASALTYAIYLIGTGQLTPKLGSVNYTALSMIVSSVAVFIHYLIVGKIENLFANKDVVWLTLNMAVFSTVIPSLAEGIRLMGSGRASIVASIGPVSTIVLAYYFL
ncbi:MAG TPA: DMT family transporter, partial [Cytophagaceae bacterium]|nr:DMT family transporter [Cytophagaceae bacterium]